MSINNMSTHAFSREVLRPSLGATCLDLQNPVDYQSMADKQRCKDLTRLADAPVPFRSPEKR